MYVRTVHELYVMLLAANAIIAKAIYPYTNWCVEFAYAFDRSTIIVETADGTKYTPGFNFQLRN